MRRAEHYREALRLIGLANRLIDDPDSVSESSYQRAVIVMLGANMHATLATGPFLAQIQRTLDNE